VPTFLLIHNLAGFPSQVSFFVALVIEPLSILLEWTKPLDTGMANQIEPLSYYTVIMAKSNLSKNIGNFTDVVTVFNGSCNSTICSAKQTFSSSRVLPYYFRVFASNQIGYNSSAFADAQNQSITTPSSPLHILARVTGVGTITLSWNPPVDTGVGDASRGLLDFLVTRTKRNSNLSCSCFCSSCLNCGSCQTDAGECCNLTIAAALGENEYSILFSGMPTGPSQYYFAITARNDAGYGASSTIANEQSVNVPGLPANLTADNTAPSVVNLFWSKPADTGVGISTTCSPSCRNITGYRVLCFASVDGLSVSCNRTELLPTTLLPSTTQLEILGLNHKADFYSFQIFAINDAGTSNASIIYPVFSIEVPTEPMSVRAQISNKPFAVDITWAPPFDTGRGGSREAIIDYVLEMALYGNFSNISDVSVICSGSSVCSNCECRVLNASIWFSTYRESPFHFRVRARNKMGLGQYSSITSSPCIGLPSEPLNLSASIGPGPLKVSLAWNNPLDNGWGPGSYRPLSGYRIYRSYNDSDFASCANASICANTVIISMCCFHDIQNITSFTDVMPSHGPAFYYFKVSAHNEAGFGPAGHYERQQGVGVPGPPKNVTIEILEPGDRFRVSWTPPTDWGLGPDVNTLPLTFYKIEVCQGNQNATLCTFPPQEVAYYYAFLDAKNLSFISSHFPGGKTYFFRVAAQNDASLGNWSAVVFKGAISLPTAPQAFQAIVSEPLQINLQWVVPVDTGDGTNLRIPVSYYIINVSTSANFSNEEKNIFYGSNFAYNFTALNQGTDYFFRIWARTDAGISAGFAISNEQGVSKPSEPRNLHVISVAPRTINVSWDSPADTGLGPFIVRPRTLAYYVLEIESSNVSLSTPLFSNIQQYFLSTSTYTFFGAKVGYYFYFRVLARNSAGFGNFSSVQRERGIDLPDPPIGLTAHVNGSLAILVSWGSPSNSGLGDNGPSFLLSESGYQLIWSTDNFTNTSWTEYLPGNASSRFFHSLQRNKTYFFRIQSRNVVGDSTASYYTASARAIGLPAPPSNFTVSASTLYEKMLQLSWNPPNDTGGGNSLVADLLYYRLVESVINNSIYVHQNTTVMYTANSIARSNLTKGVLYSFQLFASNAAGESYGSVIATEMALERPSTPYSLLASIAGPLNILLQWNRPNDTGNGVAASQPRMLISQKLQIVEGNIKRYLLLAGDISNYSLFYPYIQQGSLYVFSLSAENSAGFSLWSEPVTQTAINISSAPQNLIAHVYAPLSIMSSWQTPLNTGGIGGLWGLLNYSLLVSSSSTFEDEKVIMRSMNTSFQHTGLLKGHRYYYRVFALNEAGLSTSSNFVYEDGLSLPSKPEALSVIVSGENQLEIVWFLPVDTGIGDQSRLLSWYTLDWDSTLGSNGTFISAEAPEAGSIKTGAASQKHTFPGLTKGNTYYFRISATNQAGNSEYSETVAEQAMILPTVVRKLEFKLVSIDSQPAWVLTWQFPSETGTGNITFGSYPLPSVFGTAQPIISYVTEAGPSNEGILSVNWSSFVHSSPALDTTVKPVVPNFIYYFRVAAMNKAGRGPWFFGENTGPSITSWFPSVIPAVGGVGITIIGKRFGFSALNLVGFVGETKCVATTLISEDSSVKCVAPSGTGGRKDLRIQVAGVSVRLEKSIMYQAPEITAINPFSLSSEIAGEITILGSNFGVIDMSPKAVIVGAASVTCFKTQWISDSALKCGSRAVSQGKSRNTIQLLIDGVQSRIERSVFFEYTDSQSYHTLCNSDVSEQCFDCVVSSCYSFHLHKQDLLPGDILHSCELAAAQFCGYQDFIN
jgi:hypothetical protein